MVVAMIEISARDEAVRPVGRRCPKRTEICLHRGEFLRMQQQSLEGVLPVVAAVAVLFSK